jgi:hypothetical protein
VRERKGLRLSIRWVLVCRDACVGLRGLSSVWRRQQPLPAAAGDVVAGCWLWLCGMPQHTPADTAAQSATMCTSDDCTHAGCCCRPPSLCSISSMHRLHDKKCTAAVRVPAAQPTGGTPAVATPNSMLLLLQVPTDQPLLAHLLAGAWAQVDALGACREETACQDCRIGVLVYATETLAAQPTCSRRPDTTAPDLRCHIQLRERRTRRQGCCWVDAQAH